MIDKGIKYEDRTGFFLGGGGYDIGGGGNPANAPSSSGPTGGGGGNGSDNNHSRFDVGSGYYGETKTTPSAPPSGNDNVIYKGPAELGVTTRKVNTIDMPEPERDTGLEKQRQLNEEILDKFKKTKPEINVPEWSILTKILENPLQKFSDWSTAKNREYFENVIRAGNIPGLNFANLTDIDIEQAYQDYMDSRLSGEIDAMGRPRIDYNLDDNKDKRGTTTGILENLLLENILSPVDTTPSPTGFNYVPYSNQVVIAPGIEGLRSLIGSNAFKSIIK